MNISPVGVITGYMEADTEAREEEKEFLRDTLKSGIANWNTFNMGQQSKQQAQLASTKELVEQLKVAIPEGSFSHLPKEQQKAARANAIISIAKGGQNSVTQFLNNKNTFLQNAQTRALTKNYGFGYNPKLQNQKFLNERFIFDDEIMYTDVDDWAIQDAIDRNPTNKFDTQGVVQAMGGRYKINKASVNNYVEQLKLAHTGGMPIGLMKVNKDSNTTHNGVVYTPGAVAPLAESAAAAGALLDVDYKNATLDSRIGQEIDRGLLVKSQTAVQMATENIQIEIQKIQRKKVQTETDIAQLNEYILKETKLAQIETILNNAEASKFGAHGTLAEQYNFNISSIHELRNKVSSLGEKQKSLTPGTEEHTAISVQLDEARAQLSDAYMEGSDILTALEVYNQAAAYGSNMGTVENLSDFFTNADYRQTVKEMATFLGSITGQGFEIDPSSGVVLWQSQNSRERLALNQGMYVAATMVRDEMKNQTGGYSYVDALNNVKNKINNQSWLDTITLDGDPVLKLLGEIKIPGFETQPIDIQTMMKNLQTPLKNAQTAVNQGTKIDLRPIKDMHKQFKTNLIKYYQNSGIFPNYQAASKQATALSNSYFSSYGFTF